jgi:hypothetical protein
MTKPEKERIRIDILPNALKLHPDISDDILAAIHGEIENANSVSDSRLYTYQTIDKTSGQYVIEITAAERHAVVFLTDEQVLSVFEQAAINQGMSLQEFIKELAK